MEERSYKELRQEVKRDLERLYPGAVLLTLKQVMQIYGYRRRESCMNALEIPRVAGEHRVLYYLGDVASDIARRRMGG